jgi:hypothetical protein
MRPVIARGQGVSSDGHQSKPGARAGRPEIRVFFGNWFLFAELLYLWGGFWTRKVTQRLARAQSWSVKMRVLIVAGVLAALASSTVVGQTQTGDERGTGGARARVPSTLRYLNERIDEVAFEEAPLDQVMEWLGSLTPMQVYPRWQTLEDAGIDQDKPISMNVRGLRLSQVLWLLMKEAGGPDIVLAYRASGRLLTISTAEDLSKEMVTRVYDVADLLVRVPTIPNRMSIDLTQLSQQQGQGGGSSQSIFGGAGGGSQQYDDDRGREDDQEDIDELVNLIIQTIEPDSWTDNGGYGTIHAYNKLLVVYNNILVHQKLGGYVEEED